jgi:hypothetical protein
VVQVDRECLGGDLWWEYVRHLLCRYFTHPTAVCLATGILVVFVVPCGALWLWVVRKHRTEDDRLRLRQSISFALTWRFFRAQSDSRAQNLDHFIIHFMALWLIV